MGTGTGSVWAHPLDNVTSDESLYQRVQKLADAGLLDPADRQVLDQGRVVTRLELAFYVEKAQSHLQMAAATRISTEKSTASSPSPEAATGLEREILDLLKELEEESSYLRTRLALDDERIHQQEAELDQLISDQDKVESAFNTANKASGTPHFTSISDEKVENINVSGLYRAGATRLTNEVNLGVWSDLGGKGSVNLGLGGYVFGSNASASPVSVYLFSPSVNYNLDGKLGHWSFTVAQEDYTYDTDLGNFTRGLQPGTLRFENPFDVKRYSSDKDMKNWDDYMTNLGYVPSSEAWVNQNSTVKVFDGFYGVGTQLPLVSSDARATLLFGPNNNAIFPNQWEEGLKYSQPWLGGKLLTAFSTEWVNDNYGITPPGSPSMDMKDYEANFGIDLYPVFISLDAGFSSFYTGIDTRNPSDPQALVAPAGLASLSIYPLTLYYTAVSDGYADMQSKVVLAGFNPTRYGEPYLINASSGSNIGSSNASFFENPGYIGMVDDLVSNRYGWRANLGWKGRQESWTKDLPSFLDDIVINFDMAQKTEYTVQTDEAGYNAVQVNDLITVFYPEDTGIWGNTLWGGYNGAGPMATAYDANIASLRNNGVTETYTLLGNGYYQRIPFILPVYSAAGTIQTSGGANVYTQLDHIKTYNYVTLTTKFQFNKMFGLPTPLYGSFFFTDNGVSGFSNNPAIANMPDPYRPGQTLQSIPNLFDQTVYDAALMYQVVRNVNLMADYGLEFWKSDYTYPLVDERTDSFGLGMAYDLPWGGGKLETRYKHLIFQDTYVPANNYQADQVYVYLLFQF